MIIFCMFADFPSAWAADICVEVQGLKSNQGQVLVSLYKDAKAFPSKLKKAMQTQVVHIQKHTANTVFEAIKDGVYAIAVVHDENGDGVLNTNFIGIPIEGVGVSNHARGHMGPPTFKAASFHLKDDIQVHINIRY